MKLREGYKRIAIRVTERGVYVEHTLSERRNQWRAPARLWASFFFFLWAFARTEMQVLR
ncbi:hypothetical protein [Paenibacillus sp. E194]|uniref:hypothetical protein n=1 Tax=Paenibacillus sp. E194 TaxID=1458845 RepID=UPI001E29C69B|nr:hypothetical protein [Paenibacillus sp. E194]